LLKELLFASISDVASLYRAKEISPMELLQALFQTADELEPYLNAFISFLREPALQSAKRAEDAFLRGDTVPLLTGIPISFKDLIYTKGIKTTCGSRILHDFVPDHSATVVEKLEQQGAVMFGKTNLLEFAYGVVHPDYGQCNNPWDVGRTAGGSSSGSAASIAAGLGFASIGTDTGGSIRIPASYCGVIGVKPTYGLISTYGVFPLSWSLDHVGPITRTVEDAAIVLDAIAGYDRRDRYSHPDAGSHGSFCSHLNEDCKGIRIGYLPVSLLQGMEQEVLDIYQHALHLLQELGMELMEVTIPGYERFEDILMNVLLPEASVIHHKWMDRGDEYAPHTYRQIEEGTKRTAVRYLEALRELESFRLGLQMSLEAVDALITPSVAFPAPKEDPLIGDHEVDEMAYSGPFNVSGHPAISVNGGFTSFSLPVGIQFVGRHFSEARLLGIAHTFERSLGLNRRPDLKLMGLK
jgi:aspartyl-tRNA(Asn)/glutamyl-tRNA(Gln) amidotransferase subunit A